MKRMKIITVCIIILAVATGAAVYFYFINNKADTGKDIVALGTEADETQQDTSAAGSDETSGQTDIPQKTAEPLQTENIEISNNSPEYDLKMTLTEDNDKQVSLKLEYYYEGTGMVNTLDSTVIPEIKNIFEKRTEDSSNNTSYRIENAHLNSKLAKVYFVINGNGNSDMMQSDMYVVSLAHATIKKIFSNRGK